MYGRHVIRSIYILALKTRVSTKGYRGRERERERERVQVTRETEKMQELTESDWVHGGARGRILRWVLSTRRRIIRSCAHVYHSPVISQCFISADCASGIYVLREGRKERGKRHRGNKRRLVKPRI